MLTLKSINALAAVTPALAKAVWNAEEAYREAWQAKHEGDDPTAYRPFEVLVCDQGSPEGDADGAWADVAVIDGGPIGALHSAAHAAGLRWASVAHASELTRVRVRLK